MFRRILSFNIQREHYKILTAKRSYFCEFTGVEGNSRLERTLGNSSWGERCFSTNELVFVKMHDNTTK